MADTVAREARSGDFWLFPAAVQLALHKEMATAADGFGVLQTVSRKKPDQHHAVCEGVAAPRPARLASM